jgi:hypothetical protein
MSPRHKKKQEYRLVSQSDLVEYMYRELFQKFSEFYVYFLTETIIFDHRVNQEGIVASRETTLLPALLRQIAERSQICVKNV